MNTSPEIDKLAAALAKAMGQMEDALKDDENPHFRSRFASLASVRKSLRKPMADNAIAYPQVVRSGEGWVEVETRLIHESGQWLGETLRVPCPQATAQAVGSAASYARRYSLMAITGIAPEEDDGEAAQPARAASSGLAPAASPLSPHELQALADHLDRAGVKPSQVSRKYGVGSLRELSRAQYAEALARAKSLPDREPAPRTAEPVTEGV